LSELPRGESREGAPADAALAGRRQRQRRRAAAVLGGVVAIALVVVVVAVLALHHTSPPRQVPPPVTAPTSVIAKVSSVPVSTLAGIGAGTSRSAPVAASKGGLPPVDGKPQVLFIGALFCPYCAAERWSVAVALARFGTLRGVSQTRSTAADYPNTATLDFRHATLASRYVDFVPKEVEGSAGQQIDALTKRQLNLWIGYSGNPPAFPFLEIGSSAVVLGPSYLPDVLQGLDQQQIASRLSSPTDPVARAVDGGANLLTAAICRATGDKPADVCTAPYLAALQARVGG
jgi:hypothetical protein